MNDQIEEIKEAIDLVQVANSYLGKPKKSGTNYFYRCPFHNEKTPSFSVNPNLGIYKCFGCGESGDVLNLIQKLEGIEFPEALEIAANKAGIKLKKRVSPKDKKEFNQKKEIYKINNLVAEYYSYILSEHKLGKAGRKYAEERKLTKELIKKFKIGYAPKSYNNLLNFLQSKGYNKKQLVEWGLIVSRNGNTYDKFRSRLIFPLIDHRDHIVGFSGRTLLENKKTPKYLHSPQTLVFNKSKFLFGLNHAKNNIRKSDCTIICEGQLDVISSHKTSVKNIVASLGTSLSDQQLELAKRYSKNITFCYDADLAGEKALIRASETAHEVEMNVKAITLSQGQDADELINSDPKKWESLVDDSQEIIDHLIDRLNKRIDISKLKGKEEFALIILPVLSQVPSKIKQAHFLSKIADIINIDSKVLENELKRIKPKSSNSRSTTKEVIQKMVKESENPKEDYLLSLIIQHPQFTYVSKEYLTQDIFFTRINKNLSKNLKEFIKKQKKFDLKKFIKSQKKPLKGQIKKISLMKLNSYFELESEFKNEVMNIFNDLKTKSIKRKISSIKSKIRRAEENDNSKELELLKEKLNKQVNKLKSHK